jgi:hypothetical protein
MSRQWFWTIFFFLLLTRVSHAQFGVCTPEKLSELPQRKLIVVTEMDSPRLVEMLRKKRKTKEIDLYKASVVQYNVWMRQVVERYWPYAKDIEYMTFGDADRLRRAKSKDYAVLYCAHVENFTTKGDEGARRHSGLLWQEDFLDVNKKREHWDTYAVMEIKLIEDLGNRNTVFSQNLSNVLPDKADLAFGMQIFHHYLRAVEAKATRLSEMQDVLNYAAPLSDSITLLLRKDWLQPSLNENNVSALYPHPYQVIDAQAYQARIGCGDSTYAYVQIIPEVLSKRAKIKVNYLHLVLNASDGRVLGAYSPSGPEQDGKIITKNALKEYVRQEHNGNKW